MRKQSLENLQRWEVRAAFDLARSEGAQLNPNFTEADVNRILGPSAVDVARGLIEDERTYQRQKANEVASRSHGREFEPSAPEGRPLEATRLHNRNNELKATKLD